jgi:hypothetical protein
VNPVAFRFNLSDLIGELVLLQKQLRVTSKDVKHKVVIMHISNKV